MRMPAKALILVFAIQAMTAAANAQTTRLRGTIETVSGESFTLRSRDGQPASLRLQAPYQIAALVSAQLSDIKPGLFIGAAAAPGENGALEAIEVHIFPEALRGMGEGSRPFDLAPKSSMTNGNISALVDTVRGPEITVAYKGGEQTIIVGKATPIVRMTAGGLEDIKPGAGAIVFASGKEPDGAYDAVRLIVGRDGVQPPM